MHIDTYIHAHVVHVHAHTHVRVHTKKRRDAIKHSQVGKKTTPPKPEEENAIDTLIE